MIAALYVETDGCYFGAPGVDPWDEARDARRYAGPHAVVAHPPCQRWGRYATGAPNKPNQFRVGEDYTKCRTVCRQHGHAEQVAVRLAGPLARGAHAYLDGHTYACQACQEALFGAGVAALTINPKAKP